MTCDTEPTRFVTDPEFRYQDFAPQEQDHFEIFRVQVYMTNIDWATDSPVLGCDPAVLSVHAF